MVRLPNVKASFEARMASNQVFNPGLAHTKMRIVLCTRGWSEQLACILHSGVKTSFVLLCRSSTCNKPVLLLKTYKISTGLSSNTYFTINLNFVFIFFARHKLDVVSAGKNTVRIQKTICSGFFRNAAKKDPQEGYRTLVDSQVVYIHPSSALFNRQPEW